MRRKIIALAAIIVFGGSGIAAAQTNAPTINAAPTVTVTPSGPGAPTIPPTNSHIQNPLENPNAAGTLRGWHTKSAASGSSDNAEHGGATRMHANTHPLKALKAARQARRQPRTDQSELPHNR